MRPWVVRAAEVLGVIGGVPPEKPAESKAVRVIAAVVAVILGLAAVSLFVLAWVFAYRGQ